MEDVIVEHCGYPVFAEGLECKTLDVALDLLSRHHDKDTLITVLQSYDQDLNKKGM